MILLSQYGSMMKPMMRYFLPILSNTQHYKAFSISLESPWYVFTLGREKMLRKSDFGKKQCFASILLVIVRSVWFEARRVLKSTLGKALRLINILVEPGSNITFKAPQIFQSYGIYSHDSYVCETGVSRSTILWYWDHVGYFSVFGIYQV